MINKLNYLYGLLILGIISCDSVKEKEKEIASPEGNAKYVNTFIGTGGHGHTFPGATVPYGMVQLSPDTRTDGWDSCGGYHYTDNSIIGFTHTHLSGTGIADYGDILFMPFSGEVQLDRGTPDNPDSGFRSRFSHDQEYSQPGYYKVHLLDDKITAELTATERAGFHRYTFKPGEDQKLMIDLTHVLQEKHNKNEINEFKILSDTEISGYKLTKGWAKKQHIYFYAKFNKPFVGSLYDADSLAEGDSLKTTLSKAVLQFSSNEEPLLAVVGISSVDYNGAKQNATKEISHWDFDKIREQAYDQWNDQLKTIAIEGTTDEEKSIFYTALYHTSISPNIFNDVDGRYRKINMDIDTLPTGENTYTVFSLWDTFRAFHPLLTITNPDLDAEFINTLLKKYEEGGILPKWELAANYTGTMIGYHAIPVIVDAYFKGIRNFDVDKAYKAMIATSKFDRDNIEANNEKILEKLMPMAKKYNEELGYIPADLEIESVAKALEYAYNDWCIAQLAKDLGKDDDYEYYMERAKRYEKYFDKQSGFMRGKLADGSWRTPFDPKASSHRKDDYCEGNAWQWTWFVPHDVDGLVNLMGGRDRFTAKLDTLFSTDSNITGDQTSNDISGLIGQYAHGNEPGHHITHLYNYVGQPWKTQKLVDSVLTTLYFNNPNGLAGNEDCGQMSAWYILNAIGIYPVCPGSSVYSIGRPIFGEVNIALKNGNVFTVKTKNNSKQNKYIQGITWKNMPLNQPFIDHKEIMAGGVLEVQLGAKPNKSFGIQGHE
ncbi:glycoside hydrolase family 92 protein [Galbibacter sp. BG1]|uniref:GH92 family glycosyl hydrolase n=1 Tax=Galbibacter sp. BG1 TaxID=1170699 RepID=UPI0015B800B7|nr:GH92 family glycosyl hydrolase [Galbibacter sp. BG1]QLE02456.1 glycoside hydrolase family 92 protein [Galbibacter sp. BG1]